MLIALYTNFCEKSTKKDKKCLCLLANYFLMKFRCYFYDVLVGEDHIIKGSFHGIKNGVDYVKLGLRKF